MFLALATEKMIQDETGDSAMDCKVTLEWERPVRRPLQEPT